MNKHLYRVVFNQARGLLMVVAENAASHRSVTSPAGGRGHLMSRLAAALRPAGFAVLLALGAVIPAHAAIVADGSAPGAQQPTVISSANGTPQVNIQTPSAAGVSHNTYSQFDVDQKGAILNNSHANVQTQLGGMVAGNPALARGEATVILNEVNSRDPSRLNGYVEVAGRKADVIIANPSGITCSGCGFINANRSTLTTGTPQMENGNLKGFVVNSGEVAIDGAGLDGSRQDYTDIIARSVKVNAQITAKNLAVTTGRNQVDPSNQTVSALGDDGSAKPQMALDVSSLGGMYAGKIRLVGTERGVGVRNAGQIGASAGSVTISADGRIENSGQVRGSEDVAIGGGDISNSGTLVAGNNLTVQGANVSNSGTSVLAAGVDAQGNQTPAGSLTLQADGTLSAQGRNQAGAALQARGKGVDLSGSRTTAGSVNVDAGSGTLSTTDAQLISAGAATLTSAAHNNQRGSIVAQGDVNLNSGALNNSDGGLLQSSGSMTLNTSSLDNRNSGDRGGVRAQGNLNIASRDLNTQNGNILAQGDVGLNSDTLDNSNGGLIQGGGAVSLNATTLTNRDSGTRGGIRSQGALRIQSGTLDNQHGTTFSGGALNYQGQTLSNQAGKLVALGEMGLNSATLDNSDGGLIQSGGDLDVQATTLTNRDSGDNGGIIAQRDLRLQSRDLDNQRGVLLSGGALRYQGQTLNNDDGTLVAQSAMNLDLFNGGSNQRGLIQGSGVTLNSDRQAFDNQDGTLYSQNALTITSGDFTNQGGSVGAKEAIALTSDALNNQQNGRIIAGGSSTLTSRDLDNRGGKIQSVGDLLLTSANGVINNIAGIIRSGASAVLRADTLNNTDTQGTDQGIEGQTVSLTSNALQNQNGSVLAGSGLTVANRGALDNRNGQLVAGKTLSASGDRLALDNGGGTLNAGERLTLAAQSLGGNGQLLSLGDMQLTSQQDFTNSGTVIANGNVSLTTPGRVTNSGKLLAGGGFTLKAAQLLNQQNGEINAAQNQLTVDGTLTNYGLLDGGLTRIKANTVNNIGTGRIYGDAIALSAGTFTHQAENGVAPVLAGRQRVDLGVNTLNNAGHALIYSAGDLAIGGALDDTFRATGRADVINNHSATLESGGNMQLDAAQLNNVNDNFATELVTVGDEDIVEYGFRGVRYSPDDYTIYTYQDEVKILCIEGVICHSTDGDDWLKYSYHRTTQETRVTQSDPGKILSGGDLTINADTLLNDKSQVVAGNNLVINAANVNNVEIDGERRVTDRGEVTHYYRIQKKHSDDQGKDVTDYVPPTTIQSIRLKPSELTDHGAVAGSGFTPDPLKAQHTDAQINPAIGAVKPLDARDLKPGQQYTVPQADDVEVRISGPDTRLPDSSLFKTDPAPSAQYLVETDPRFTNNKIWLGSDYMLKQIASDPNKTQKRLGDGFYEQRLVREQIISLTGQRYLNGYASDEEQYKALMNNGVRFANEYGLTLGVDLTPDQMKLLTGDIVWLVNRDVTLPDGSVQRVLVPQVYARVKSGDIDGSGALLAGKNLGMGLSGGLLNKGTIAATDRLVINADNITNQVGTLQGADVSLAARTDINNLGGIMQGENALLVSAGRDINLVTTTRSAEQGNFARSAIDSVSGTYVQGDNGKLVLQAGRDLTLTAAQVSNSGENGQTQLSAGRDLTLNTVNTGSRDDLLFNDNDWSKASSTQQVGSEVTGKGDVTLLAGRDASLTAATASAGDALRLQAGNTVTLNNGVNTADVDQYLKTHGSGFLSKSTREKQLTTHTENGVSTLLSGDSVQVGAGNDIRVTGSSVAGTHDVLLDAGHDLTVEDAVTRQRDYAMVNETKSGLSGTGGIGVSYGKQRTKTTDEGNSLTSSGSTLGSSKGSLTLQAGNQLSVKGSDLIAQQDMLLSGKEVSVLAAQQQTSQTHTVEQKTSGLTLALSGAAGSAVNNAVQQSRAARDQDDSRLAALQATKAALTGYQAEQAVRLDAAKGASDATNNDTVGISLSYGSQSSKSTQHSEQRTSQGSSLTAGNNLDVVARGSGAPGADGDITVVGSQLKAGRDVSLSANRDVNLFSGENTSSLTGKNESKGGSVGVGIGAGSGGWGINVSASVNKGKGSERGNGTTWSETTVDAGRQVNMVSGRDTTLTGAQVSGNRIVADVGRDFTLTSQQDTDTYDSKQQNASAGASFNVGSMTGSASVNMSRDKLHSNYQSVNEQTGLFAGSGGFDVTVGNHTQLNGAVIGSTADAGKNRLDTGTLGFSDIHNQADFQTEHQSAGFSTGGSIGSQFAGNMANTLLAGGNNSGHDDGTTRSAVSDGTITVRDGANQHQSVSDLSRDVEHANGSIDPIFDKEKEQKRLEQAQLIGEIGNQVGDIARTEGDIAALNASRAELAKHNIYEPDATDSAARKANYQQLLTATESYKAAQQQWGTGSAVQQGIQAATAAVQGLAAGNMQAAIAGGAAPYMAEVIHNMTTDAQGHVNVEANLMAHAVVGAVVAQLQGNSALAGAAGATTGEFIAQQMYPGVKRSDLTEQQRQTISALSTLAAGLAGGVAGDSTSGAIAGAQGGKNAAENNNSGMDGFGSRFWSNVQAQGSLVNNANLNDGKGNVMNPITPEEIKSVSNKQVTGDLPEGANITKVVVNGYKDGALILAAGYLGPAASAGQVAAGATIATAANGIFQWFDINSAQNQGLPVNQQKTWDYWGSASAAVTGALAPGREFLPNLGIALGGTVFTDGPDAKALGITAGVATVGGLYSYMLPLGVSKFTDKKVPSFFIDATSALGSEYLSGSLKDSGTTQQPSGDTQQKDKK